MELIYRLSNTSRLILKRGDITKYHGDAIVNAANERMLGGGGVDGAIHHAAGPALMEACKLVEATGGLRCPTGEARITSAGDLPVKYVIHTAGPVYQSKQASAPLLYNSYKNSLELAANNNVTTIAFPALSCGIFGYPWNEASEVALNACHKWVKEPVSDVTFVLFEEGVFCAFQSQAESMGLKRKEEKGEL
eukprot:CAMPEP_0196585688 /NCGR_PEP_ID=MMETSP1081-20130531/51609_1 /TAXON_ID=36882 /ORGANISM="Pyramimonas amylifera, Strain CCMP720" /LENGTH=191 /DNA_ID=CAMNT_0041907309 /DNA_START=214 /DNA_END=789 /DNA_ORIENTATION=+